MDIETVKTIVKRYKELLKEKYLKYDKEVFHDLLQHIDKYDCINIATDSKKYQNNFYTKTSANILVIIEKHNILKLFHYTPLVLFYTNIIAKTITDTLKDFENNTDCVYTGLSKLTLYVYYPKYDWFFNEMLIHLKVSEIKTYIDKNGYSFYYDMPIIQDDNHYFILFPEYLFPDKEESSNEESQEDELDKDIKTLEK